MTEQDGIWGLTLQPRKWLRWLPIEKIDDWLIYRAYFKAKLPGRLPLTPRWYHYWNTFAFCLDWEWEEVEDEMNYTPAPWKENCSPDGKETGITGPESELNEPVCIIPHDDVTEEGMEEVKANMALIQNAPAMYEQLDDLIPVLEYLYQTYNSAEAYSHRLSIEKLLDSMNKDNT